MSAWQLLNCSELRISAVMKCYSSTLDCIQIDITMLWFRIFDLRKSW